MDETLLVPITVAVDMLGKVLMIRNLDESAATNSSINCSAVNAKDQTKDNIPFHAHVLYSTSTTNLRYV